MDWPKEHADTSRNVRMAVIAGSTVIGYIYYSDVVRSLIDHRVPVPQRDLPDSLRTVAVEMVPGSILYKGAIEQSLGL